MSQIALDSMLVTRNDAHSYAASLQPHDSYSFADRICGLIRLDNNRWIVRIALICFENKFRSAFVYWLIERDGFGCLTYSDVTQTRKGWLMAK